MACFQLSFYSLFSSGRSEFPSSGDLKPLSRQACFLHAQQIMLNFSPEPNLPWVLMYYFMFTILKTAAHSNAKEPPIKRQRHQRFYWVSPKSFTSMVIQGVIQICGEDLQVDLYFRFRSMSLICSPTEAGGV